MNNATKKIAVTGANGLIGSRIIELLKDKFSFIPLTSADLEITDKQAVQKQLPKIDFDILLHLAAYTNVDGAEENRNLAYRVNVEGTANLFSVVERLGKKFIYISTDFIFSGNNPPYDETSQPDPINYYGKTKYQGEKILQNKAMIVRLSYPYRRSFSQKSDFVRTILNLLQKNQEVKTVVDSQITPTFIDDIAFGLGHLINNFQPTIYHLVGSEHLSPFEASMRIARKFKLDERLIKPINYSEYFANREKRPRFSIMKSCKNNFYPMSKFLEKW